MNDSLYGKHVVVTRAPHQAQEFAQMLEAAGAIPVLYPAIQVQSLEDTSALDDALTSLGDYDWLLVTSRNTVFVLWQRIKVLGVQPDLDGVSIAAVGPSTADAVKAYLGADVDLVPSEHIAEGLLTELPSMTGQRVLLPQSAIARPVITDELRSAGATVDAISAYETVMGTGGEDVPALLQKGRIDALTFTSASTVKHFALRVGGLADSQHIPAACIGPQTGDAAHEAGFEHVIMPEHYTLTGLTQALKAYFEGQKYGSR